MMPSKRWWIVVMSISCLFGMLPMLAQLHYGSEELGQLLADEDGWPMFEYRFDAELGDLDFRERELLVRHGTDDWRGERLRVGRIVHGLGFATLIGDVVMEGPEIAGVEWPQSTATIKAGWPLKCFSSRSTDQGTNYPEDRRWIRSWETYNIENGGIFRPTRSSIRAIRLPVSWNWPQVHAPAVRVLEDDSDSSPSNGWKRFALISHIDPVTLFINAMLWGTPLTAMLLTIHVAKRLNRRRRGLCTTCKYPLEGLTTCTECGTSDHRARA